jgi:hypothetical protein
MRKIAPLLIALLLGLLLTLRATTPPAPLAADVAPDRFSAGRAMADVRVIAAKPHPNATPENAEVRAHIAARMQALGMEVSNEVGTVGARASEVRNRWSGRADPPTPLVNVIGVLPGKDRALPAVLLMSHHDSVWGSPGAADDTAGVAASLEVMRALKTGGQPARDVVMLVTDAEELGLEGAEHFFASNPLRETVGAVINMEARGGGGRTTLFQTSRENGAAVALYADNVSRPGASSLATFIYSVLPNDTDLSPLLDADTTGRYAAYNFAFIGRSGYYHSPKITPDMLDQGSLQDMGSQVLDLTRALAVAAPLPAKAPDLVFFDLFGLTTVTYPQAAGWLLLALAALGLAYASVGTPLRDRLEGIGRSLALIFGAGLLLFVLNKLSYAAGEANYYDRLAEIPRLELMALYAAMAGVMLAFAGWRARPGNAVGVALPVLLLGIVAQHYAPTAAYIMVVPVTLVALAHAVAKRWPGPGAQWLSVVVASLVFGYMLALGHQLMQGVGPTTPFVAALPLAIAMAALAPLLPALTTRKALISALVFTLAGASTAVAIRSDPLADTIAVYSNDKATTAIPVTKPE